MMLCANCHRTELLSQITGGVFICDCRMNYFRANALPPEAPATVADHPTDSAPFPEAAAGAAILDFPDIPKFLKRARAS